MTSEKVVDASWEHNEFPFRLPKITDLGFQMDI